MYLKNIEFKFQYDKTPPKIKNPTLKALEIVA